MEIVTTTWGWFKADLSTIKNGLNGSSPIDNKIIVAGIRAIALVSAAFLALAAAKSLAGGSFIFACIKLFLAGIGFDIFLLFKKFSEINEPVKSAVKSASGKGFIQGVYHGVKGLGNSISSQAQLHTSLEESGKIKVTILTKDTNFAFVWNRVLVLALPNILSE